MTWGGYIAFYLGNDVGLSGGFMIKRISNGLLAGPALAVNAGINDQSNRAMHFHTEHAKVLKRVFV